MPLLEDIGALPNGGNAGLDLHQALQYLKRNYLFDRAEQNRREIHRIRQMLYRDGGDGILMQDIDAFFEDPRVKELRKRFVSIAKHNNVSKRLVNEVSTVYSRPARRKVNGAFNDSQYQRFLRATRHDQVMRRSNRFTNLHRQTLLGFRVRRHDRMPQSMVVTPDRFWAVCHPLDSTRLIAVIIDIETRTCEASIQSPSFVIWTDFETAQLTSDGTLVEGTYKEHGLGLMPWLLVSMEPPMDSLLDIEDGSDLSAGHRSVWFQNILLLKESKSLNNQTYLSGDLQDTPTGQSADPEIPAVIGEDVQVQSVDSGVDLAQFRENGDHIYQGLAANWGIPPSVLSQEGATSGFEIELRRIGIRERRVEQVPIFRDVERDFAIIQSTVLQREAPEWSFLTDGWRIDFGETETPQDRSQRLTDFRQERELGLTNTLEMIQEQNPDLSPLDAAMVLRRNIEIETMRIQAMQEQQRMNQGPDAQPGEPNAEDNGAEGLNQAQ